jgi:hypothetical protein
MLGWRDISAGGDRALRPHYSDRDSAPARFLNWVRFGKNGHLTARRAPFALIEIGFVLAKSRLHPYLSLRPPLRREHQNLCDARRRLVLA